MKIAESPSAADQVLFIRINQVLAELDQRLHCASEDASTCDDLGRYYILDGTDVVAKDCDLVELAQRLGVLSHSEMLVGSQ